MHDRRKRNLSIDVNVISSFVTNCLMVVLECRFFTVPSFRQGIIRSLRTTKCCISSHHTRNTLGVVYILILEYYFPIFVQGSPNTSQYSQLRYQANPEFCLPHFIKLFREAHPLHD